MSTSTNVVTNNPIDHIEKVLVQYGTKGMRWGVRKSRTSSSESHAPTGPESVSLGLDKKNKLVAKGGRGHAPSEDAKASAALRQKAAASGSHSLSNAEMKVIVERMNLEGQYAKLLAANAPAQSMGSKFLSDFLKSEQASLAKGQKPKSVKFVQFIIGKNKGRKARNATQAAAAVKVAGVLTGKVVNR